MKSLKEFNQDLSEKTTKHMGFDLSKYPQRSQQWLDSRLGVITASKAICLLKDGRKAGTKSALWDTYMLELIAEIATKEAKHTPVTNAIDHGNAYEAEARELFSFETGLQVDELTFCYRDDMRAGASPDGVINEKCIIEIKCPYNTNYHLNFLFDDADIKQEYIHQMQFQMWVLDADLCYYIDYDPRMQSNQIKYIEIEKDYDVHAKLEERVGEFVDEMDKKLELLELKYGSQWKA